MGHVRLGLRTHENTRELDLEADFIGELWLASLCNAASAGPWNSPDRNPPDTHRGLDLENVGLGQAANPTAHIGVRTEGSLCQTGPLPPLVHMTSRAGSRPGRKTTLAGK